MLFMLSLLRFSVATFSVNKDLFIKLFPCILFEK